MATSKKNIMRFFWWLETVLFWWAKSRVTPDETAELGIDPDKPVCYILRSRSITDLLILDHHCRKLGLPRPLYKPLLQRNRKTGSYIYLVKAGLVQLKSAKQAPTPLFKLVKEITSCDDDVQLVPVSVLWGRYPGKEEKSLFKLLFTDDENSGIFQRFFTVIAHGRSVHCNLGLPISLKQLTNEGLGLEQTTRKLRRVLRVHFRSFRIATLGPHIFDRNQMIISILKSPAVKKSIVEEAKRKKMSEERLRRDAFRYIDEIAARLTTHIVRGFVIVLGWVWNKIYSGVQVFNHERLRQEVSNHEIVYLPCHRSHLDYLLIGYKLFELGFMPPHVAAGINLNFWPMGTLMRGTGAFFIRRSFKGNRLYSVIFNEYVQYLMSKGFSLKFYLEGGRSRTGRSLSPKTGMLNMVVQGYAKDPSRPVLLVPVYVGYDRIMEGSNYIGELGGKKKKNESMGQLLGAAKILKGNFGKAYMNFGVPMDLGALLKDFDLKKKDDEVTAGGIASSGKAVQSIARRVMVEINSSIVVSPSSLFSSILLASSKRSLAEKDLLDFAGLLIRMLNEVPYSEDIQVGAESPAEQLAYLEKISDIKRFSHPDGDVIYVDEKEAVQLTYYRNNALHIFAIPAIVAAFFQHSDQLDRDSLRQSCLSIIPFLREELFLRYSDEEFEVYYEKIIDFMIETGFLVCGADKTRLERPEVTTSEFNFLNLLGRFLGRTLERYAVTSAMLSRIDVDEVINRSDFEKKCQLMSQRIAILNGTNDPDFFDKALYKRHFDLLCELSHLESVGDGAYSVKQGSRDSSVRILGLLSVDVRRSIKRSSLASKESSK